MKIFRFSTILLATILLCLIYEKHVESAEITGFDSKAYTGGKGFPPYQNGTIRIYGMRFCPYTHRVLLVLSAKDLSFEIVNINFKSKPDWFLRKINPAGKVPVLQYNDIVMPESLDIAEWLDQKFQNTTVVLLSNDNKTRSDQKQLVDRLGQLYSYASGFVRDPSNATKRNLQDTLKIWENLLKDNYYAGDKPGWVDYIQWPQLERLEMVKYVNAPSLSNDILTNQKYPKLTAYIEHMKNRPEVKRVGRTPQQHLAYTEGVLHGRPDYDLGISE